MTCVKWVAIRFRIVKNQAVLLEHCSLKTLMPEGRLALRKDRQIKAQPKGAKSMHFTCHKQDFQRNILECTHLPLHNQLTMEICSPAAVIHEQKDIGCLKLLSANVRQKIVDKFATEDSQVRQCFM